ncbi:MAG: hypothetical protein KTQ12_03585 [Dermatophilaceae bacterium]|nr:hypothetical protein [Dermatophilaceae bacterium]
MTKTNDWGHRLSDIPVGTRIRVAAGASRLSTEVTGVAVAVGIARVKTKKAPYYGHRYGYGSAEWAFDESKPGNWIVVDLGDGKRDTVNVSRVRLIGDEAIDAEDHRRAEASAQRAAEEAHKKARRAAGKEAEDALRDISGERLVVDYDGFVKLPVDTLVRLIADPDLTADFAAAYTEAREAQS